MQPSKINVLVTGSQGQLAQALAYTQPQNNTLSVTYATKKQLDITQTDALQAFLTAHPIHFLINCAAYTQVDLAETNQETVHAINAAAPGYLAKLSQQLGFTLIHISTDYVFEGLVAHPLTEEMPTHPVNYYGKSKLAGEQLILSYHAPAYIIRTSWLYSARGNNFLTRLLKNASQEKKIYMAYNQISSPTYALDLAQAIWAIIQQLHQNAAAYQPGIYHYANQGVASRYDFAWNISKQAHLNCEIHAKSSHDFRGFTKRPAYTVLDTTKIQHTFGLTIPHWQESLAHCLYCLT